jgi:hypothetical protein
MPGYSGENQFSIFFPIFQNYGIVQKLEIIIIDNTAPNNVLCRTIEIYYKNKERKK